MPGFVDNVRGRANRIRDRLFIEGNSVESPPLRDGNALPESAGRDIEEVSERFETILSSAVSDEERSSAKRFWDSLRAGKDPDRVDLGSVEAIVERYDRPVFFVTNDTVDSSAVPPRWEGIDDPATHLGAFIRATGRIDADGLPADYAGTGVYVGPGLIATNRHVALQLCNKIVKGRTELERRAWINFGLERQSAGTDVEIKAALLIHPYWDFAILECEQLVGVEPVKLAAVASGADGVNRTPMIVVVGFPAMSGDYPFLENRIFQGEYGIKRVQPGYERGPRDFATSIVSPFGRPYPKVRAGTHDASTLGGNSGSGVFEVGASSVRGFHFAGKALERNFFVPSSEIARDPRVRDLGVGFDRLAPLSLDPSVEDEWRRYFNATLPPVAPSFKREGLPTFEAPVPSDWIERFEYGQRRALSAEAPSRYAIEIEASIGAEGAKVLATQSAVATWDPMLPEVILVPGWAGSHLLDVAGVGTRRWLSPETFRDETLASELGLSADGTADADGCRMVADGVVQWMYLAAVTAWRARGFIVHEFAYDWRRSVASNADRLDGFIRDRIVERPGARLALVAHSFGGLIAAAWAARNPERVDRVQRAVLVGVPLGGAMTAVECAAGGDALAKKLELVTASVRGEFARVLGSCPGALDVLPDPMVYPDAATLYQSSTWGDQSLRAALDDSLCLKHTLRRSPLLERAVAIASSSWGTVASFSGRGDALSLGPRTVPGDGVVTLHSALVHPMPAWRSDASHWELLRAPRVIDAVGQILTEGSVQALDAIRLPVGLEGAQPPPDVSDAEDTPAEAPYRAFGRKLGAAFTNEALSWLFAPGITPPSSFPK